MTPATITISTEDESVIDRLRAGMDSRELFDLFGLKLTGVKLETYTNLGHPHAVMISQQVSMVETVVAPQWSGEGLPPVGTRLECQYAVEGFTTWHAGECIGVGFSPEGEAMCVVKAGETISCYRAGSRIRPIRTPSQIAAELRTATIKRAAELCPYPRADSTLVVLEALYDNGILKGDAK